MIDWDNLKTEDYRKIDLKKLTREQALWVIRGGRKKYERYREFMLQRYSEEDMKKEDEFRLALFRDKNPQKARRIAESIKDPTLRKDCLIEIKAWQQACIVG
ncbi:MAG: hypothetical protein JRI45_10600 [Deltaproteobacteria bacterium]|nr:hypothetical protein [Deltaproteobacteria bacterium]MBW2069520.1 hypothetical protein [Deltaproteobacteria bacterium]